jgi:hypothetical protein
MNLTMQWPFLPVPGVQLKPDMGQHAIPILVVVLVRARVLVQLTREFAGALMVRLFWELPWSSRCL